MEKHFELEDAYKRREESPETFELPTSEEIDALVVGKIVKLIFRIEADNDCSVERMWVVIKSINDDRSQFKGVLDSDPVIEGTEVASGMEVVFEPRHIIAIYKD
ncbi:MAG: hypothetical protein ACI83D_000562 [Planctomycetota bacterium]|jgi:hypothetical protein